VFEVCAGQWNGWIQNIKYIEWQTNNSITKNQLESVNDKYLLYKNNTFKMLNP